MCIVLVTVSTLTSHVTKHRRWDTCKRNYKSAHAHKFPLSVVVFVWVPRLLEATQVQHWDCMHAPFASVYIVCPLCVASFPGDPQIYLVGVQSRRPILLSLSLLPSPPLLSLSLLPSPPLPSPPLPSPPLLSLSHLLSSLSWRWYRALKATRWA